MAPLTLRLAALTAAVALAPAALAQGGTPIAPCTGGVATLGSRQYSCAAVDLMAHLPLSSFSPSTPESANEIWGWTDPETGAEIALVGLSNGVGFVDVSTPEAPAYLGKLTSATGGDNLWRTFRVYSDHLFVGSEAGGHGIQVFDLTRLRGVSAPQAFAADARYTGVSNTHTLTIDEQSGFLYAVGTDACGGGPHIVDVRTPLEPAFAGCYSDDGYTHEAQCLTYAGPDPEHAGKELCFLYQGFGGWETGGQVAIVDMTDKDAPEVIGAANYPNPGYSHQGWLTPDGARVLINDEFDQSSQGTRTIVVNVADLDNPEFEFNYYAPTETYAHNLYTVGRYAFTSNYTGGLRVVDVAGVASGALVEVAHFDTFPQGDFYAYDGQWMNYPYFASGTVVAADITNGLFVLRPTGLNVDAAPAPAAGTFSLAEAAPNPTSGTATLALTLAAPEHVRATLHTVTGREVAVLHDGPVDGPFTLRAHTDGLAAGVYLVRVAGTSFTATRRLTVSR